MNSYELFVLFTVPPLNAIKSNTVQKLEVYKILNAPKILGAYAQQSCIFLKKK